MGDDVAKAWRAVTSDMSGGAVAMAGAGARPNGLTPKLNAPAPRSPPDRGVASAAVAASPRKAGSVLAAQSPASANGGGDDAAAVDDTAADPATAARAPDDRGAPHR